MIIFGRTSFSGVGGPYFQGRLLFKFSGRFHGFECVLKSYSCWMDFCNFERFVSRLSWGDQLIVHELHSTFWNWKKGKDGTENAWKHNSGTYIYIHKESHSPQLPTTGQPARKVVRPLFRREVRRENKQQQNTKEAEVYQQNQARLRSSHEFTDESP